MWDIIEALFPASVHWFTSRRVMQSAMELHENSSANCAALSPITDSHQTISVRHAARDQELLSSWL